MTKQRPRLLEHYDELSATYRIVDKDSLADVAGWIITNKGRLRPRTRVTPKSDVARLPWRSVAPEIRQLQPTLNRLRARSLNSIRASTFWQLHELLPDDEEDRIEHLHRAVFSEAAVHAQFAYDRWMRDASGRSFSGAMPVFRWLGKDALVELGRPNLIRLDETVEMGGLDSASRETVRRQNDVLQVVFADAYCRRALARFAGAQWKAEHDSARIAFGILRIVGPLFAWHDTYGIERHARELSTDELHKFIDSGVQRESILLHRPAKRARAQAAHPALMASPAEPKRTKRKR